MGANPSSENKSELVTKSVINAITDITQDAGGGYQSINTIDLTDCQLNNSVLKQGNTLKVNADITQSITNDADYQNNLDEKVEQIAKSQAEGMNLPWGQPQANSLLKKITDLQTNISQNISANCHVDGLQVNAFHCLRSGLTDTYISQENLGNFYMTCSQNSKNVTNAQQDLASFIEQNSDSESKSVIVGVIIALVFLVVVITIAALVAGKLKKEHMP